MNLRYRDERVMEVRGKGNCYYCGLKFVLLVALIFTILLLETMRNDIEASFLVE